MPFAAKKIKNHDQVFNLKSAIENLYIHMKIPPFWYVNLKVHYHRFQYFFKIIEIFFFFFFFFDKNDIVKKFDNWKYKSTHFDEK